MVSFVCRYLQRFAVLGVLLLFCGFVSMLRIRRYYIKYQEGNKLDKIDKLEKLMLRISAFSFMYIVPAVVTLACLGYQSSALPAWLRTWFVYVPTSSITIHLRLTTV